MSCCGEHIKCVLFGVSDDSGFNWILDCERGIYFIVCFLIGDNIWQIPKGKNPVNLEIME